MVYKPVISACLTFNKNCLTVVPMIYRQYPRVVISNFKAVPYYKEDQNTLKSKADFPICFFLAVCLCNIVFLTSNGLKKNLGIPW